MGAWKREEGQEPTTRAPLPEQVSQRETPDARQAFEDYWALGPSRSMRRLAEEYKTRKAAGKSVPTIQERQLETWSSTFGWMERAMNRTAQVAEQAEAQVAGERAAWARQRLDEAHGTHTIAAAVVQEIIKRIKSGELQKLPFVGYWTTIQFTQEAIEQDWDACGTCNPAAPDLDCTHCGGTGRILKNTGKRRVTAGSRVVKVDGLADLLPMAISAMNTGQALERKELGDQNTQEELIDALLRCLPDALRLEVAAGLAEQLSRGAVGPPRRP